MLLSTLIGHTAIVMTIGHDCQADDKSDACAEPKKTSKPRMSDYFSTIKLSTDSVSENDREERFRYA